MFIYEAINSDQELRGYYTAQAVITLRNDGRLSLLRNFLGSAPIKKITANIDWVSNFEKSLEPDLQAYALGIMNTYGLILKQDIKKGHDLLHKALSLGLIDAGWELLKLDERLGYITSGAS